MATTNRAWATEGGGLVYAWRDDADGSPWQVRRENWDGGVWKGECIVASLGNHRTPEAAERAIAKVAGAEGWTEVKG
jgi:hypothetical protein